MIVYENRNQLGCEDAAQAFSDFVRNAPEASTIDRVSYLFGVQAFCRDQLKQELTAAMDALETGADRPVDFKTAEMMMSPMPV